MSKHIANESVGKNYTLIVKAFKMWRRLINVNSRIEGELVNPPERFQSVFQQVALHSDLKDVFRVGQEQGFNEQSVVSILILHGGYFRLLKESNLAPEQFRYIDSLYQETFPSIGYYSKSESLLAPWITLSAQEALLDMPLKSMAVVE